MDTGSRGQRKHVITQLSPAAELGTELRTRPTMNSNVKCAGREAVKNFVFVNQSPEVVYKSQVHRWKAHLAR